MKRQSAGCICATKKIQETGILLNTRFGQAILRKAVQEDLSSVADLYRTVFSGHSLFDQAHDQVMDYLKATHEDNAPLGCGYMIIKTTDCCQEKKIIGAALLEHSAGDMFDSCIGFTIRHVAVSPDHTRAGLGKGLIRKCEDNIKHICRESGQKEASVKLAVLQDNIKAIRFYLRHGFQMISECDSSFYDNSRAFIMQKSILPDNSITRDIDTAVSQLQNFQEHLHPQETQKRMHRLSALPLLGHGIPSV